MQVKIEKAECDFDGVANLVTTISAALATEGHFIERLDMVNKPDNRGAVLTFSGHKLEPKT
jgi:hypothetical protein